MKKLAYFFAALLLLSGSKALAIPSELSLRLYDNAPFYVVLDNDVYENHNSRITIGQLAPGSHHLKVFKHRQSPYGYTGSPKLVFNGFVVIPESSKVRGVITRHFRFKVVSTKRIYGGHGHNGHHGNGHYGHNGYYGQSGSNGYYGNNAHQNGSGYYSGPMAMNEMDFRSLRNSVRHTSFDNSRLKILKQAISMNYVSSEQVREMLSWLTFESSRLKIAKFAYSNTIDKERYFVVNDAFTFSSSIDELNRYILRH